jgi:hypothetical protein
VDLFPGQGWTYQLAFDDPAPATQTLHLNVLRDQPMFTSHTASSPAASPEPTVPALELGRQARQRRDWQQAFDLLSRADAEHALEPVDLEALGEAALWSGHPTEAIAARRRTHTAYLESGEIRSAARLALDLAANNFIRSEFAVGRGWSETAARLLAGQPEGPEHGFLTFLRCMAMFEGGQLDDAFGAAQRVLDSGRRFHVPDLEALGIVLQGLVLARQERIAEAVLLLDEAMAMATPAVAFRCGRPD